MKLITFIASLALLIILSACDVTGDAPPPPDLSAQRNNARSTVSAIDKRIAAQTFVAQTAVAKEIRAAQQTAAAKREAIDQANAQQTADARAIEKRERELALAMRETNATATAQHIKLQAMQTAEAAERHRAQAEIEAEAAQRNAIFYSYFWPVTGVLLTFAAFVFAMVALNQWLVVFGLRRLVMETRAGTINFFQTESGAYAPRLLQAPTSYDSEAHVINPDPIKVYANGAMQYIPREDPDESRRKLVLRLLRAAMEQEGGQSDRIPTYGDLGWSSDTWVKAVASLKPFVETKQGRGGGTKCSAQYPTLAALYDAVGRRQIALSPAPPN